MFFSVYKNLLNSFLMIRRFRDLIIVTTTICSSSGQRARYVKQRNNNVYHHQKRVYARELYARANIRLIFYAKITNNDLCKYVYLVLTKVYRARAHPFVFNFNFVYAAQHIFPLNAQFGSAYH